MEIQSAINLFEGYLLKETDSAMLLAWQTLKSAALAQLSLNTGSLQLLNRMKTVLPMVKNGMNSVQIFAVRGVIADAIDQLQEGA